MLTQFSKLSLVFAALVLMILLQFCVLAHAVEHYQAIGLELSHPDFPSGGEHEAGCDICLAAKLLSWTVLFAALIWSLLKTVPTLFALLPDSRAISPFKSFYAQAPPAQA